MVEAQGNCIIIGGSIAGTFAAAAAAGTFQRVLVVDKDKLETSIEVLKQPNLQFDTICEEARRHRSVPQSLQVHALMPGGGGSVEKLLPGFYEQCIRSGAVWTAADYDVGKQINLNFGAQQTAAMRVPERYQLLLGSRMLFERCARAMLLEQYPNVQFHSACKVAEILYDDSKRSVKGVHLASGKEVLAALVIDTSGGRSQAVINFIQDKSGEKVETINYDVGLNYYTRFFKMPERELQLPERERLQVTMFAPRAPVSDGGMVLRMEGNMYQALVSRMNKKKCGPSLDDYLGMLKSLPDLGPYKALQGAEPLGPSLDYLGAQGTQRQFYEKIQNWPDNYVVLGDALAHLNPRFGSGMSAAAFQAEMLKEQLTAAAAAAGSSHARQALTSEDLKGWSSRIQKQAAKAVDLPYSLVRDGDLAYDFCTGPRTSGPMQSAMRVYINGIQDLLPHSPEVASVWLTVASFLTPPSHFFKPVVVRQVLAHLLAQKWAAASSAVRCLLMATSLLMAAVVFSPFLRVRA